MTAARMVDRRLADAWDELAARTAAPPFLHRWWFEAWWEAFGSGAPDIVTVAGAGEVRAVLPLAEAGAVRRSMANWHTPEFDAVGDDAARTDVVHEVLARRPQQVDLRFVDRTSPLPGAIEEVARTRRFAVLERVLERSPYVELAGSWNEYLGSRRRPFRSELRRRARRLEEQGQVRFEVHDDPAELDPLLTEGFAVESSGWKGQRGTAIAASPATERFYRSVAHAARDVGQLRLGVLRLDGRAIAFDIALQDGRRHYLLKTGYDPSLASFSPGSQLRAHMLERAFADRLESYEFLGSDEPWKLDWTGTARERLAIQVFAPTALGRARHAAYAYGRPLAKQALARAKRVARSR